MSTPMFRRSRRARPPRRRARRILATTTIALAVAVAAVPVAADPPPASATDVSTVVPDWNAHVTAVFANGPAADPPGAGFAPGVVLVHLAMAQLAMYDAAIAIDGGYEPYVAGLPPAAPGASTTAAVATAARDVVAGVETVPPLATDVVDWVQQQWSDSIATAVAEDGTTATTDGIATGAAAAAAILAERADDGRFVPAAFTTGTDVGVWRPTPPGFVNAPFAWLGDVDPYVIAAAADYRTRGPHDLGSGIYAREYDELVRLGGPLGDTERTAGQEATAQFFQFDPASGINRILAVEAAERGLSVADQARLFAVANAAGADAIIACFADKEYWGFWRPITAIVDGDADGNRRTVGDPDWVPRNGTPPYPEHPSGYNCVTAAYAHGGEAVLGRGRADVALVKPVPDGPDEVRHYAHLRDITEDTIDARIFQGLHFRAADVQGVELGRDVARWIARHAFRPTS